MGAADVTLTALVLVSISRTGYSQFFGPADSSLNQKQIPSDQDKLPTTEATLQKIYITLRKLPYWDSRLGIEIDNALTTKANKVMDDLYHVTKQTVDDIHTKEEIVPSYIDGDTFDRQSKPSEKLYQTTTNTLNDGRKKQEITESEVFKINPILSTNGVPITKNIDMIDDVKRKRLTTVTTDIAATTKKSSTGNLEMTPRITTKSDNGISAATTDLKQTEQEYHSTSEKKQLVMSTIATTPTTEVKFPVKITPWLTRLIGENMSTSKTTKHIESKDYSTSVARYVEDSTTKKTTPSSPTSSVSSSHLLLMTTDQRKQTSVRYSDKKESAITIKSAQDGQTSTSTTVKQVNVRSSPRTVRMTTSSPTSSTSSYLPLRTTAQTKQTKTQQSDDNTPPVTSKNRQDGLVSTPTSVEPVSVHSSRRATRMPSSSPTSSVSSNLPLTTTAQVKQKITQQFDESTLPVTSTSSQDGQTSSFTKRVDADSSSVKNNSNSRALLIHGSAFYQRLQARCSQHFVLESFQGLRGVIECAVKCSLNNQCKSFNYTNTKNFCQLHSEEVQNWDYDGISQQGTCNYYQKVQVQNPL